MTLRRLLVATAFLLLAAATVLILAAFDARSHSASDTLRPFIITVVPLWLAAALVARALLRRT